MGRRVHTADDVLRHARAGAAEMVVAPTDLLTPLARDIAHERGVRVVVSEGPDVTASFGAQKGPAPEGGGADGSEPSWGSGVGRDGRRPRVQLVKGVDAMPLGPFPVDLGRPEMDVRLLDVLGAEQGLPMSTGVMSLRAGSFPWTLDYDEVEYVIEGELHITTADQQVVGLPGDVIAVPKGSSITFGTPSWARFLYVTYPAEWGGTS